MIMRASAVVFLASLGSAAVGSAQPPHPFSVHDMLAMDRISDPRVSPDGKSVAFTVRVTDVEGNRGRTDIWIAAMDGSKARKLTAHEANDSDARWMPDGKSLVFLSTRGGSSQVWQVPALGGEARALTSLPLDVSNLEVFPDGKRLLFTMEVYPDAAPGREIEETARRDAEREKSKVKAKIYDSLLFRHWDTWEDGKRRHVFVWEIGSTEPLDLMRGFDADGPTRPFGGTEELAISPDGKEVAFAAKMMTRDAAWSTDVNVYTVPSRGGAEPRSVSGESRATDTQPAYSPDGRLLAYLAMSRPGYESDRLRIVVVDRATGTKRVLTDGWDRSASEIVWSADSRTIYTSADSVGHTSLFAVDVASGSVSMLAERGTNKTPRPAGDRLIVAVDTLHSPVELLSMAADGSDVRPVTRLNAAKVAAAQMGEFEQFHFTGARGDRVYGYLVKPVGFTPGERYPVAFLIHGGPQGSFGNHFHYRWNPQAYAGAGYAVLMIDFHGSTGYGQAFTDAIRGDWGGAPYEDLMKGLDHALATYPFLDGKRVAALGASYGAYMVNWIAGHTDRFQALVCHDGNLDERMAYFSTEELWFPEWEHGGPPWEHPEAFVKHNPIDHVKNWKTPTLVIHGALDYRVVETQGMSTFTALQRRGIPSKLLYFPDENHWVLKPQNSILWHDTVLGWIDQWVKNAGAAKGSQ
jgi:dipeptidyl aminopeptidase/acylaminoacyl peptidase